MKCFSLEATACTIRKVNGQKWYDAAPYSLFKGSCHLFDFAYFYTQTNKEEWLHVFTPTIRIMKGTGIHFQDTFGVNLFDFLEETRGFIYTRETIEKLVCLFEKTLLDSYHDEHEEWLHFFKRCLEQDCVIYFQKHEDSYAYNNILKKGDDLLDPHLKEIEAAIADAERTIFTTTTHFHSHIETVRILKNKGGSVAMPDIRTAKEYARGIWKGKVKRIEVISSIDVKEID